MSGRGQTPMRTLLRVVERWLTVDEVDAGHVKTLVASGFVEVDDDGLVMPTVEGWEVYKTMGGTR